ncbi:pilin [Haloarcula amylovorans]|uniref:pilin n=1 Tax=Haloarcula amylovorans TaxID=2562280 RepID=UPI001ADDC18B|nr:pilin [Halomicroarcula amylolytica]
MSATSNASDDSPSNQTRRTAIREHARWGLLTATSNPRFRSLLQLSLIVVLFSGSAMAQTSVGSVYCGTPVETAISLVFGAIAALGMPAAMFFTGRSGLSYMRATGNPNQQNQARQDLILSVTGLAIVFLALIAPEIISKLGSELGFSFSSCVNPFGG